MACMLKTYGYVLQTNYVHMYVNTNTLICFQDTDGIVGK